MDYTEIRRVALNEPKKSTLALLQKSTFQQALRFTPIRDPGLTIAGTRLEPILEEARFKHCGSITQPYLEEYRLLTFSRRYVRHLPGWYAQKQPDEDRAETFAVWMKPNFDWRAEYADRPTTLAKLNYSEQTMARLTDRDPVITVADLDEEE